MNEVTILDVKINNVSLNQTITLINNFIVHSHPKQIVTVNPEFIMTASDDKEFKQILNNSDLSVPDGSGLLFVSRYILKKPLQERVTGVDLVWAITKLASKKKYPIYFLGGAPNVAEKTALMLKNKYSDLIIAGSYAGNPKIRDSKFNDFRELRMTDIKRGIKDPNMEIVKKIRQAKPKILFVAYGAPKQDKFIARYKKILNVPVMMGVGGTFDFISGKTHRAPRWIQKIGLEWLWRLLLEPWRWKRIYTAVIKFPWMIIKDKFSQKTGLS